jgi:hypothetical protein
MVTITCRFDSLLDPSTHHPEIQSISEFVLQLRAGFDGEWLADLFLKDYTQYSTSGYYVDSVTIPRVKFNALVANKPNGVSKEFSFSLWVPPGSGEFYRLFVIDAVIL